MRGRARDQLGEARVVESDDRGHRAVTTLPRRLHQATAFTNEPDAVLEGEGTRRDEG